MAIYGMRMFGVNGVQELSSRHFPASRQASVLIFFSFGENTGLREENCSDLDCGFGPELVFLPLGE